MGELNLINDLEYRTLIADIFANNSKPIAEG